MTLVQQQQDRSWGRVQTRTVISPTTGSLIATVDLIRAIEKGDSDIARQFAAALAIDDVPPTGQRIVRGTERFEARGRQVFRTWDFEDIPPPPVLTDDQKLDRLAILNQFDDRDDLLRILADRLGLTP